MQQQGGLGQILSQVLGQAMSGTREGAGRLQQSAQLDQKINELTGRKPEEILAQHGIELP